MMKNVSSERTERHQELGADLGTLDQLIEELRGRLGGLRGHARQQLAYKKAVSEAKLRKFQNPGFYPDLETLQSLITHYHPGMELSTSGGLRKATSKDADYWIKGTEAKGEDVFHINPR
ncbi:hypothetical protein A8B78_10045 [Jannaschia sp. EhC01]|nr:hypothetical protein A8B78_10045 [Jannaschia sp. EhC01]